MFSSFQLAKKYLYYYFTASNGKGHGIHSPFVFDFVKNVLNDRKIYSIYQEIEYLRLELLNNNKVVQVEDMGAGSFASKHKQRRVSDIARVAVKSKKYGQLLFRIIKHYRPQHIFELGTSLGLTTSYLALGNIHGSVVALEGALEIANIARVNFDKLAVRNVQVHDGNFDNTLAEALLKIPTIDFAFIDGNHRKEPTVLYFNELLCKINDASILIFDDIHWSTEMEEAWETIKAHSSVTLSIDLFFIGLLFFRKDFRIKQHFVIKF